MKTETRVALANLWESLYTKYGENIESFRSGTLTFRDMITKNGRDYTEYLNAKGIIVGMDGDYTQDGALSGEE